jgi:hypothetical protein
MILQVAVRQGSQPLHDINLRERPGPEVHDPRLTLAEVRLNYLAITCLRDAA